MFSGPPSTTKERFKTRVALHKYQKKSVSRHHFWWFMHNCVAHPFIGLFPKWDWTFKFHDYTSDKINLFK